MLPESKNDKKVVVKLLKNTTRCYFISPHLDDAVYSAGGLLSFIAQKVPTVLVTVFSKGGTPPFTFSAKQHLKINKVTSPEEIYNKRKREDREVGSYLGVKIIHLDFPDALFRKLTTLGKMRGRFSKYIPEFSYQYPTYKHHVISDSIAKDDSSVSDLIRQLKITVLNKNSLIFCPLGVGTHIDHNIVRIACQSVFSNPVYWLDFPYYQTPSKQVLTYVKHEDLREFKWKIAQSEKLQLMMRYRSQIQFLKKVKKATFALERYYY